MLFPIYSCICVFSWIPSYRITPSDVVIQRNAHAHATSIHMLFSCRASFGWLACIAMQVVSASKCGEAKAPKRGTHPRHYGRNACSHCNERHLGGQGMQIMSNSSPETLHPRMRLYTPTSKAPGMIEYYDAPDPPTQGGGMARERKTDAHMPRPNITSVQKRRRCRNQ